MAYNINNCSELSQIAKYCATAASNQALDKMTGPQGIREHIINFFTFAAIRKENAKPYHEFAKAMTAALHQASLDTHTCTIPDRLVVNFAGYTVIFTQPEIHHHAADFVTIEISQAAETIRAEVDRDKFLLISTALQLRQLGGLPSSAVVLTKDNCMKLRKANFCDADLRLVDLRKADLSGANLRQANLSGANLSGVSLNGVNLDWVNLSGANLSGANLRQANLSGLNLSGANLSRANLCWANLCWTNLSEANLSEANLSGADLEGANLYKANLSEVNLRVVNLGENNLEVARRSRVNLSEANLSGANLSGLALLGLNLSGTNLNGANLSRAKLNWTDLSGANLSGANLSGINLSGAILSGANLSGANLSGSKLGGAILSGINLSGANLSGVNLGGANLNKVKLCGANLSRADLSSANLSEANLSGANLSAANLNRTILNKADLSSANLSKVNLIGSWLNEANLDNILQKGGFIMMPQGRPKWDNRTLDLYLNHINNTESGSLLTMMDSLDEQYAAVKLHMARELMATLLEEQVKLSNVALPLMDILSKPPYIDDTDIAAWMSTVCETYLNDNGTRVMPQNTGLFNLSVDLFARRPERMLSLNGPFIQIVAQGMAENSLPEMKQKAADLYATYLRDERIKAYSDWEDFGNGEGQPDWDDKHAVNYILMSAQPATVSAMLLSPHDLESMLRPQPETQWDRFYLYSSPDNNLAMNEYPPLNTLFANEFPLFNTPYQFIEKSAKFVQLLKTLNLGDSLHKLFVSATEAKHSKTKLVSPEKENELRSIFEPKLTYSADLGRYSLKQAHYNEIINAYRLTSATPSNKAKTLLCLAALFTKYSSSAFFGTETDSPQRLRNYAYALMEKGHNLDANIVKKEHFALWTDKLLGLNNTFSCSAILSSDMVNHIRARFPDVLSGIMPPAWG
ncbi:pentapeptide repeat-containing protein [Yersinia frederiksenii]|uniref:pentapeptide repeat-containing protein n=1 Tax=Yersinia frederiksenii TaxID=29484 RepID=UPI0005DE934B|nr:pentapeptide repeat-containing protein [Yersinia frederiksenii]CFQ84043.1 pentapeptide repeat-containing protein [Yersinia frederiksenii]